MSRKDGGVAKALAMSLAAVADVAATPPVEWPSAALAGPLGVENARQIVARGHSPLTKLVETLRTHPEAELLIDLLLCAAREQQHRRWYNANELLWYRLATMAHIHPLNRYPRGPWPPYGAPETASVTGAAGVRLDVRV